MIRVRPADLDRDLEAVNAVGTRNGFPRFDPEERRRWLRAHPFRKECEDIPFGWVLEDDARGIIGTFTNVPMIYELDGKRLRAALASSWAVDGSYRSASLLLAFAYLNQKSVDLCLNGDANPAASRVMDALKVFRVPVEDGDAALYWIVRARAFAAFALRRKRIPGASALAFPVAPFLRIFEAFQGKRRGPGSDVRRLDGFGDAFDALWNEVRKSPGRLRAVRTSAVLDWRYGRAVKKGIAILLGLFEENRLRGYAVLMPNAGGRLDLKTYILADIQMIGDPQTGVSDLLRAAIREAREDGREALRWQGGGGEARAAARSLRPWSHHLPAWPAFYKSVNPGLAPDLSRPECWDLSPFDVF